MAKKTAKNKFDWPGEKAAEQKLMKGKKLPKEMSAADGFG